MSEPPKEFRADLHCHTKCSDGSLSPKEMIHLAAAQGLQGLAITDHDTIDAYEEALPAALESGIELISGVEFSTVHLGVSIHVLAYSFPVDSPVIRTFCAAHQKRRGKRTREMLRLLNKHGMPLTEEELYASRKSNHGIGRPHIAQAMIDKGYVKDIKEAFKKYLGEGKPCYSSGTPNSVEETLECIKQANGIAVLAHPHLIDNAAVLKSLLSMPFEGLESYYARFAINQNKRWLDIANTRGWLATGGSDFHGEIKPAIPLGCSWTREETFHTLQNRFLANNPTLQR